MKLNELTAQQVNAQRRLYILSLLHTRPHTEAELYAALVANGLLTPDRHDQTVMSSAQHSQFRRDLAAIRAIGCDIQCDRRTSLYTWCNSPFGLALPPTHLTAFAIILDTFTATHLPHAADIRALLTRLLNLLPAEQQRSVTSRRRPFTIDLHELSNYSDADQHNLGCIERAIEQRMRLHFTYRTPRDGRERQHEVEPLKLQYRGGHVYLHGWHIRRNKELPYRLDNIIPHSARVGNTPVQHQRVGAQPITICYRLGAAIARNPISQHFDHQQVEHHPDGSATVTAQTRDLFEARRILLSYGEHCTVFGPPALVTEMRQTAAAMCRNYDNLPA